jgi:hypothetical protein
MAHRMMTIAWICPVGIVAAPADDAALALAYAVPAAR